MDAARPKDWAGGSWPHPLWQVNEMKRTSRFLLLCMMALLVIACSEQATKFYPKYEDAANDGAVKRGWIPEIVPKTATEIHEHHNLDTNEVWIRFNVPRLDRNRLTAGLKKLTDEEIAKIKMKHPSKVSWWFEGLTQQSPANDNALNSEVFRVNCNGDGYLASDRVSERVYYWCTGRKP